MKRGESVLIASIFLVALYAFWNTFSMPVSFDPKVPGPAFFPRMILIFLFAYIALYVFLRKKKLQAPPKDREAGIKNGLLSAVLSVVYLLAMPFLGYFLSTFIYVAALLWLFDVKKITSLVFIPGAFVVVVYFIFFRLMAIDFPMGIFA